ncbi:hypothetical protein Taro_037806 [Colocasia esculenta]|uniref:Uncharacterized protein n=1 Tax=Colocasia esculenta TaxID=4460 RepID=A0A843W532_COLES|nr:hypothetical protein [Colocasia esculenta]
MAAKILSSIMKLLVAAVVLFGLLSSSGMAQPSCPTQSCAASPGACTAIDCVKICSTSLPGGPHKACCKAGRCCCYN